MAESSALPKLIDPISRREKLHTGLTYHWLEWGAADAPIVVLLHGFLDFAWTWEAVVNSGHLSRYRVIAPDLRGYGDTDKRGPYDLDTITNDVCHLIESLGEKRAKIVTRPHDDPHVALGEQGDKADELQRVPDALLGGHEQRLAVEVLALPARNR